MKNLWLRAAEFNRHVWSDPIRPKTNPVGFVLTAVLLGGFFSSPLWYHPAPQKPFPPPNCVCK